MGRVFQKRVEDFTCGHCGNKVSGAGYTDHCPKCLWSKHVDVNPGDRESTCRSLMEPVDLRFKGSVYTIIYRCQSCGYTKQNKVQEGDSFDAVIALSKRLHEKRKL